MVMRSISLLCGLIAVVFLANTSLMAVEYNLDEKPLGSNQGLTQQSQSGQSSCEQQNGGTFAVAPPPSPEPFYDYAYNYGYGYFGYYDYPLPPLTKYAGSLGVSNGC
jgi:hypothetical protein